MAKSSFSFSTKSESSSGIDIDPWINKIILICNYILQLFIS